MRRLAPNITLVLALGFTATVARTAQAQNNPRSLAGSWRFQLDRDDVGLHERWFERELPQRIDLPSALQNQGFGDEVSVETKWTANVNDRSWYTSPKFEKYRQPGKVKIPFWLQPEKHYVGAAWYQREIEIPSAWQGRRVVLTLERPHWETRVWLDGTFIGTNDSLSTPHVYDLGTSLVPGEHTLTIRVDNRLMVDVGVWAHSVSDHTQGNWNGVVGRIELSATSSVWIEDAQAFPDVAKKSALFKVRIGNATGKPGAGTLSVGTQNVQVRWDATGGAAELEIALGGKAELWDEFKPALQRLPLRLKGDSADDQRVVTFGLRHIGTEDRLFTINGRKTFFRGTLECCIFPRTGYPATDVDSWKRIIRICQAHGLNHIRFHSWCPPEAAFVAADELGFYYQVEIAAWTTVGNGAAIDHWLYQEAERITRAYGNHPSFVLMPYGNEPGGPKHKEYLAQWVNYWKALDARRLYTSASGWPSLAENQYHVTPAPRGPSGWIGKDYRDAITNLHAPVIVHEMAQWCVYPNFDEIPKYTGPLKAKNFVIFRDSLTEHGMLDQWRDFLRASGKLQALCYKEEIEAALRTPGVSGIQLLDLHDFPGQGTALVGVLDAFWDSKGYITPAEFRRFYGSTVPLARMARRVWTSDETFAAEVEAAHFGAAPLENTATYWKLMDEKGHAAAQGEFPAKTIPVDRGIALGRIEVPLGNLAAPNKYKLIVGLKNTSFENDWNIWLYPAKTDSTAPPGVLITSTLDEKAAARLAEGGKVLLLATELSSEHPRGSFTPVFWNRQWFPSQGCQTLGLLCDPKHPALKGFPTDFHSEWQWEDIVKNSRAFVMDSLPRTLRPIVQVIDDWNTNRKLGLAWECQVSKGKLLVCSANLEKDLDQRPAARQLRASLLAYMAGPQFNPQVVVSKDDLSRLLEPPDKSPSLPLAFRPGTNGEFHFDTGLLRGKLRTGGRSLGLSSVVHIPSGIILDRSMGLFSHYRVFTANTRYGDGAWDWPSTAKLRDDGAVEVQWPAADSRPLSMSAVYRWRDAGTLDLETIVTAAQALPNFEVFLASYLHERFTNSLVFSHSDPARGGKAGFVSAARSSGDWQMFPRDETVVSLITDGRWSIEPHPVEWSIQPRFGKALGVRRDTRSGLTAVVMAPPADCFAVATPYETEGHYSLYLSLFGRDVKAGETVRARARLVIATGLPNERITELYETYLKNP